MPARVRITKFMVNLTLFYGLTPPHELPLRVSRITRKGISALKKLLSKLFAKDTLLKIILVQVIILLFMFITSGRIEIYHRGSIDLGSQYGGVEIKIQQ